MAAACQLTFAVRPIFLLLFTLLPYTVRVRYVKRALGSSPAKQAAWGRTPEIITEIIPTQPTRDFLSRRNSARVNGRTAHYGTRRRSVKISNIIPGAQRHNLHYPRVSLRRREKTQRRTYIRAYIAYQRVRGS